MTSTLTKPMTEINLGSVSQVPPGEGREFRVEGVLIAVFHSRNGSVYATQALCPHREAPLADSLLGGSTIQCPYHAWKFNLVTGERLGGEACSLTTYPVSLTSTGDILLTT